MSRENEEKFFPPNDAFKSDAANTAASDPVTDELEHDGKDGSAFKEIQEQADAVDRVLMKKGPPEYDLTSG